MDAVSTAEQKDVAQYTVYLRTTERFREKFRLFYNYINVYQGNISVTLKVKT